MKEERETNTFIKELKTGNNRIFSSRFTYNMDNNDYTSDDFYIQLKKTKSMRSSYFTYKNNNKNNGKNYNNKLIILTEIFQILIENKVLKIHGKKIVLKV